MTQRSRAEIDAAIAANIPDNTDQLVTPALVRSTLEDMADSALWLDEGGAGPVDSVNGYTGTIVLTAADVGAIATGAGALLAGATFTGPVAFSGTTNSGIRLNNLTTTQRDALVSPLAGMKIWNTTAGAEQVYNGASWIGATGVDLNAEIDAIQLAGGAELTEFNANIATAAADGGAPFDLATAADIWAVEAGNLPIVAQELGNAEAYVSITPTAGDYTIDGELGWRFKDTALAGNADFATVSNLTPRRREVYIKASGGTRTLTATGVVATSNIASGVDIATGDTGRFDFYINAAGDSTCEFMGADDWLLGASGVVLESAYNANTILAADTDDTPAPVTIAEERIVGRITGGNIKGMTAAETRTFVTTTSGAVGFGTIELGAASDTTIARDSAGLISVEGQPLYPHMPLTSLSTAKTFDITEANRVWLHPAADTNARTWTIPAHGSVAYPEGTWFTFVNETANAITIALTTQTLRWAPSGGTGSRTLAQYGTATAIKKSATEWTISGVGLT